MLANQNFSSINNETVFENACVAGSEAQHSAARGKNLIPCHCRSFGALISVTTRPRLPMQCLCVSLISNVNLHLDLTLYKVHKVSYAQYLSPYSHTQGELRQISKSVDREKMIMSSGTQIRGKREKFVYIHQLKVQCLRRSICRMPQNVSAS